jgi:hypothetical protein
MQPRDAHRRAELKFVCVDAHIFNYADDLMAGNQQRFPRGEFAFNHMKIGAANTTIADANQDFVFGRLRGGNVGKDERILFDQRRYAKESGFHADSMLADIVHDPSICEFLRGGRLN